MTQFNTNALFNAFGAGQDMRRQNMLAEMMQQDRQRATGLANTQGKIENALSSGDRAGAQQLAAGSGDADVMRGLREAIAGMDEQQRQQARERAQAFAGVGASLLQIPYEQRQAALSNPQVQAQLQGFGIDPQQLAGFDPTDANIQAAIGPAAQISDLLERTNPVTLDTGDQRVRTIGGVDTTTAENVDEVGRMNAGTRRQELALSRDELGENRRQFNIENDPDRPNPDIADDEDALRREVNAAAGDAAELFRSYDVMFNSYNVDNAQGDLALLVAFTKALDPGSVAREGEVQLSQSSASAVQNAANWRRRLEEGNTRLPQAVRDGMIEWAQQQAEIDRQSWARQRQGYEGLVERRRYNPENIFIRAPGEAVRPNTGAAPFDAAGYEDGTVIEGPDGARYVVRNGRAEPQ
jgi:hypothetical protein